MLEHREFWQWMGAEPQEALDATMLKNIDDSTGLRHIRRPLSLSGLVAFAALGKPLGDNVDASNGLACALLGIATL